MMSAWWTIRSMSAIAEPALGKIVGQSLKARFVVSRRLFLSCRRLITWKRERVDQALVGEETLHPRGIGGAIEVGHQDLRCPPVVRAGAWSDSSAGRGCFPCGWSRRRAGPGRIQRGAEQHPPIPVIARVHGYDVPSDDRKPAQDGRALESHGPAWEASHPATARGARTWSRPSAAASRAATSPRLLPEEASCKP